MSNFTWMGSIGFSAILLLASGFYAGRILYRVNHGLEFQVELTVFSLLVGLLIAVMMFALSRRS